MAKNKPTPSITAKANNVLNVIFLILLCISIKIWHLTIIRHDDLEAKARKPQIKTIIERAERGSIRDRFNIPLAINRVRYNATIVYSQLNNIPRITYIKDGDGKKIVVYKRRKHIEELSSVLASILNMEASRIEDIIYSKAALLPNVPYIIKEDISEQQYFKLKLLEKDWVGLQAELASMRYYPNEKNSCDIIGYLGPISTHQYHSISNEIQNISDVIKSSENNLPYSLPTNISSIEEARERLQKLEDKAYSINDMVGKIGIEAQFDEQLRGFYGKRQFQADARGNFLREINEQHKPIHGQRILLTISAELQDFAEKLLIQNERIRDGKSIHYDLDKNKYTNLKQPWIKGGAVVVIDPNNGEVLTMASYPRFNPNDFISSGNSKIQEKKNSSIHRWLESEKHIAEVWNGTAPLEREIFSKKSKTVESEKQYLNWNQYLQHIFPQDNKVYKSLQSLNTIGDAIEIQKIILKLKEITQHNDVIDIINAIYEEPQHKSYYKINADKQSIHQNIEQNLQEFNRCKSALQRYFEDLTYNHDKVLLLDLLALSARYETFSPELLDTVWDISLTDHFTSMQKFYKLEKIAYNIFSELFNQYHFKPWLENNKEKFLKQKRKEEKLTKTYHKPYLDLLDQQELIMRKIFWDQHSTDIMLAFLIGSEAFAYISEELYNYILHFDNIQSELNNGLKDQIDWYTDYMSIKNIIHTIPIELLQDYLLTLRNYEKLTFPLYGKYRRLRQKNEAQTEKHLAAAFYPQYGFGYGRSYAFRQAAPQGSIFKLVTAYSCLYEYYKQINGVGDINPLTIYDNPHPQKNGKKWNIGTYIDNKPISQYYKGGSLPRSARKNIGKIDIVKAIETSSNPYFSMLAGDILEDPEQLNRDSRALGFGSKTGIDLPGEIGGSLPKDLRSNKTGLYSHAIGQHSLVVTPLQTAMMLSSFANGGTLYKPKIVKMIVGKENNNIQEEVKDNNLYENLITDFPSIVRNKIDMPDPIRNTILNGAYNVINKPDGCAYINRIRNYNNNPEAMRAMSKFRLYMCGKTGTAERVENVSLDVNTGTYIYKHIWFSGIAFEDKIEESASIIYDKYGKADVVVVVYLCYGDYGRETTPLAAQIIEKWREIRNRY